MLDKFKYVWSRFTSKVEGNLAEDESCDFGELERTRKRLADLRSKTSRSTSTSNLDLEVVRKRITQEVETGNCITVRHRDSRAIGKWFGSEENQTDSGSFDTKELHRRIDEMQNAHHEEVHNLESYPDMEDTFLAFSKPEEDLFDDEERISLSGVHYKIDPIEDLEEEYTLPGLPMFEDDEAPQVSDLDIREVAEVKEMDFSPIEEKQVQENNSAVNSTTKDILASLEERIAQNKINNNFWVDSGV